MKKMKRTLAVLFYMSALVNASLWAQESGEAPAQVAPDAVHQEKDVHHKAVKEARIAKRKEHREHKKEMMQHKREMRKERREKNMAMKERRQEAIKKHKAAHEPVEKKELKDN